mgnify:FL=1
MVKVVPLSGIEPGTAGRLGFMAGEIAVPDDFDQMGAQEIDALFAGRTI